MRPILSTFVLVACAGLCADDSPAAGKRYPSERSVYRDEETGREVIRLTTSPAEDVKIYQTHPSWTSNGEWIVFHSDRAGSPQVFAVHEETGDIVQLTDEEDVSVGQICLSRRRPELLTVVGRSVVRLRFERLPGRAGDAGDDKDDIDSAGPLREEVGRIPGGTRLSGTMSWDAAEKELYLGLAHESPGDGESWSIAGLGVDTGELRKIIDLDFRVGHVQANPWRSGLLQYCHETGGDAPQRMWVVRSDGTGNRPFYPETFDEWVTHEVWWTRDRALFTVWPKNEAMLRKPHGIASVSLDGDLAFHSRFPYWHVAGTLGSAYAAGDTSAGEIYRVDLRTGERELLTRGHRLERRGAHPHQSLHPDGDRVLFNSNAGGSADLYVVRLKKPGEPDDTAKLRRRQYSSRGRADATRWQNELRAELRALLRIDDLAQKDLPLNATVVSTERRENYTLKEVELDSTPVRRMRVLLTVPVDRKGRAPAVVCIHGHGGTRRSVHDKGSIYKGFAAHLAENGVVTIAADVGQHRIQESGRTLMGERLWDLMRCVDYLETLDHVDPSRIGCGGLSLGGEMAMWLGALDERIAATVSSGFLTTMDQMEQNHCMCWELDGLRELVDYADIYALTAPRALQCQNGLREGPTDFWVPIARHAMREIRTIYGDFGHPERAGLVVHEGGHEIDLPSLLGFFEDEL